MHKLPIPIAHDIHVGKTQRPLLHKAAIILVGISLAPLVAEVGSICYAQWSQVLGRNAEAETPVLNSLGEGLDSGRQSVLGAISSCFQRVPWNHQLVLAVGAILMIIGMIMLKL